MSDIITWKHPKTILRFLLSRLHKRKSYPKDCDECFDLNEEFCCGICDEVDFILDCIDELHPCQNCKHNNGSSENRDKLFCAQCTFYDETNGRLQNLEVDGEE